MALEDVSFSRRHMAWYPVSQNPSTDAGIGSLVDLMPDEDFDFEKYTYIVCREYELVKFSYTKGYTTRWENYMLRYGFSTLMPSEFPQVGNIYRIKKIWVELPFSHERDYQTEKIIERK